MNEVSLDPRQAPARDERLLAADFGRQARGRPIHGRLDRERGQWRRRARAEAEARRRPDAPARLRAERRPRMTPLTGTPRASPPARPS